MTTATLPDSPRRGPMRIVVAVWLLIISVLAVVDHVALSKLQADMDERVSDTATESRLSELEQKLEEITRQPTPVSQASFTTTRQEMETRLTKIEQLADGSARGNDLSLLQARLTTIETRLSKALRTAVLPRQPAPVSPTITDPPFSVLGIELRGTERVLALAPAGSHSLADVRLLRVGEVQSGWQLETLNGHVAEFRIDGRLQRIGVP